MRSLLDLSKPDSRPISINPKEKQVAIELGFEPSKKDRTQKAKTIIPPD